jgi:CDP-glucose 4,6-dehydratase
MTDSLFIILRMSLLAGIEAPRSVRGHPREAHFLKIRCLQGEGEGLLRLGSIGPLHLTLDWILEWYRAFQAGTALGVFTRTQMERYEALLQN